MKIMNHGDLEDRLIRLVETRSLESLINKQDLEYLVESLKKENKATDTTFKSAALFDTTDRIRTQISSLQENAQNGAGAVSMLKTANRSMNYQMQNIDNILNKLTFLKIVK